MSGDHLGKSQNAHLLAEARDAASSLEADFSTRLQVNRDLKRSLVSFQANKAEPIYRWFKYREGFSKSLIEYIIDHSGLENPARVLDPFAGTGATCFVATQYGFDAIGIELLPVGSHFIRLRNEIDKIPSAKIIEWLDDISEGKPWDQHNDATPFEHLNITAGAFSNDTEIELSKYRTWCAAHNHPKSLFLDFIAYSLLEDISYTRKDGQYLRWDHRSPRVKLRGNFDKGKIYEFAEAIHKKASSIRMDLTDESMDLFDLQRGDNFRGNFHLFEGSNFEVMEKIDKESIDLVITSPPYCNRYDYTRTYALELAYLGCDEAKVRQLRQQLLSCTVENRPKDLKGVVNSEALDRATKAFNSNSSLQKALAFLEAEAAVGNLNNNGIVKMVRGYFFEMAVHISQLAQVMKPSGLVYMVNDNVRYNGLDIPVDCILSDFAEKMGFICKKIWVLPMGKGNSSQQMKAHGRSELRKCVYIWERQDS
ncbi:restriction endonuclease [Sphingomonas lacunae]|uniref:Restriction endonuclease n=1 Tax=Sphingomonas lacunae TaxID=2698828 RepID=A0A6M4AV42_9SPHN|nr:DNA methyltransferase [Sphingomonas lacunae]QJQ32280.1 restriction endonuclease [Sphingomonas lacunae]